MAKDSVRFLVSALLLGVLVAMPLPAQEKSAWEVMLETNPAAGEDDSITPLERTILNALTPEQAEAYQDGADPSTIRLAGGDTLADLIGASLNGGGPELVYVSMTSCRLFGTWFQGSPGPPMIADEVRTLFARGTDLSAQGGSATGCGIPTEAVAFMAQLRVMQPTAKGLIKAWPAGGVVGMSQLLDYDPASGVRRTNTASILEICTGMCAGGDFNIKTLFGGAHVQVDTVGFFKPLVLGSGGGLDADLLDGLDSTDFALAAHTHDGADITSGTVGEPYIDPLIARDDEIVPTVLASDGTGSGLDADLLDGRDSLDLMLQVGNCLTVSPSCPAVAAEALAARCWKTVSEALAAINGSDLPLATAMNRYVIKVGPGIYNESFTMKPFVDIEGSGQKLTTVSDALDSSSVVGGADNAELRSLTVENTGGGAGLSIAVGNFAAAPMYRHVTFRASGGGAGNIAMVSSSNASPTLVHATLLALDETGLDAAVETNTTSTVVIRDSVLEGDNRSALAGNGSTLSIVNTQLIGPVVDGAGVNTITCLGAYDAAFAELGTDCQP